MDDYGNLLNLIHEDDVVKLCQDLVRFNTTNPPGDERECIEYVADFLREAGLDVEIISHTPTRSSLIAKLKGSGEIPALMYSGHVDVVPVGAQDWKRAPFAAELDDGKIWGRGTSDMKGGDAAILSAVKALSEADLELKGDLILVITAGEEGEQLGASVVAERSDLAPLQGIIIPEPSENDVYIAEKGAFWLKLTTYGKTAHGSMPEHGRNAIMMMVALLSELDEMDVPFEAHDLLGRFTRSIDTIEGGVKTNVVPDQCQVTIDQRTVPGQDHQAILKQVEDLIDDLSQKIPGFEASAEVINDMVPVETSPDEPVVQNFYDVVEEVTGKRPQPMGVSYYTDGAVLAPSFEAPLIICGPGIADLAHQPNEYIEVSKLVEGAKILTLAAAQVLG